MSRWIYVCVLSMLLSACTASFSETASPPPGVQQPIRSSDTMRVPTEVVIKINKILGVPEQPHFANVPHERLATQCLVWKLQSISDPIDAEQVPLDVQAMISSDIDNKLAQVRAVLIRENVIAYKSIEYWVGVHKTASRKIVVCPSIDQFDILRFEQGPSPYSDSEYYIAELEKYDEEYGIDVTGAGYNVVEFSLKRIPTGQEAKELSSRILKFAPAIAYSGDEEVEFIDFNCSNGRVALWWD